jgi:hypothetical protein
VSEIELVDHFDDLANRRMVHFRHYSAAVRPRSCSLVLIAAVICVLRRPTSYQRRHLSSVGSCKGRPDCPDGTTAFAEPSGPARPPSGSCPASLGARRNWLRTRRHRLHGCESTPTSLSLLTTMGNAHFALTQITSSLVPGCQQIATPHPSHNCPFRTASAQHLRWFYKNMSRTFAALSSRLAKSRTR